MSGTEFPEPVELSPAENPNKVGRWASIVTRAALVGGLVGSVGYTIVRNPGQMWGTHNRQDPSLILDAQANIDNYANRLYPTANAQTRITWTYIDPPSAEVSSGVQGKGVIGWFSDDELTKEHVQAPQGQDCLLDTPYDVQQQSKDRATVAVDNSGDLAVIPADTKYPTLIFANPSNVYGSLRPADIQTANELSQVYGCR